MMNRNLGPISHRFSDTATYRLKSAHCSYFTPVQPQI